MKLEPLRLGVATAVAVGIVWVICSVFVIGTPGMAMYAAGGMMHGEANAMVMQVTPIGFVVGLAGWSLGAGLTAWLVAALYNAFGAREPKTQA